MANLLRWLVGWVPRRTQFSTGREPDDGSAPMGMEAAFAPTQPAIYSEQQSAPAAFDAEWAIRRLNSRSVH